MKQATLNAITLISSNLLQILLINLWQVFNNATSKQSLISKSCKLKARNSVGTAPEF